MPANTKSKFAQLTNVPRPLPDLPAEEPAAAPAPPPEPGPEPRPEPPSTSRRAPALVPTATARAASTIRLRPSAAEPLNEAWLHERQTRDPKLSYPEFASRIVALGLAAYKRQESRRV